MLKMNGAKYREIFDENLLQSAQDLRLGRPFTFQQDSDPKHTAKTMQEWLRDKCNGFPPLPLKRRCSMDQTKMRRGKCS